MRVSDGEEGEGHSMQRDRRHKRLGKPTVESLVRVAVVKCESSLSTSVCSNVMSQ